LFFVAVRGSRAPNPVGVLGIGRQVGGAVIEIVGIAVGLDVLAPHADLLLQRGILAVRSAR
jgi:hypothetical protein